MNEQIPCLGMATATDLAMPMVMVMAMDPATDLATVLLTVMAMAPELVMVVDTVTDMAMAAATAGEAQVATAPDTTQAMVTVTVTVTVMAMGMVTDRATGMAMVTDRAAAMVTEVDGMKTKFDIGDAVNYKGEKRIVLSISIGRDRRITYFTLAGNIITVPVSEELLTSWDDELDKKQG